MIVGIGVDIAEIDRIKKAADKAAFLTRVFTEREISLYRDRGENPSVLAGCFAGKEAVAKALGTGFRGFWPLDIEILRDEKGGPMAVLRGKALEIAQSMDIKRWHVSITNTADWAAAFVVAEN